MDEKRYWDLQPIAQEIFDLMRRQPGDIFSPEALAAELDYPPAEIGAGLEQLQQLGLVDQVSGAAESITYILNPSAPEI
jgi:DNA-binding IclR family transcriptional regulator